MYNKFSHNKNVFLSMTVATVPRTIILYFPAILVRNFPEPTQSFQIHASSLWYLV